MKIKILIAITLTYRLIPSPIRGLWRMHGSTSHIALAGLRAGNITAFRSAKNTWLSGKLG